MSNVIERLNEAIVTLNDALHEEVGKSILDGTAEKVIAKRKAKADHLADMVNNSPSDISARYWLMEFLEPLNRKEMKSFIDGFLVQLLNEEQARKLVKFLLIRFPQYYTEDVRKPIDPKLEIETDTVKVEAPPKIEVEVEQSKPKPKAEPELEDDFDDEDVEGL